MAGPNPPSPGVSGISPTGARTRIQQPTRPRFRSGQLKEGIGQQADPNRPPPGARRVRQSVVEVPIGVRRQSVASWQSADGNSYAYYMKHPDTGADIPGLRLFALYMAIRELSIGGDPLIVYKAFKVSFPPDINGLVPEVPSAGAFTPSAADEIIRAVGRETMAEVTELPGAGSFSLGDEG